MTLTRRSILALDFANRAARADHWIRVHRTAMACRVEVALSGEDARHVASARGALDLADQLESRLTVFRESSELMRVNRSAGEGAVEVAADLFALLARCRALYDATDGAFDITSTPLSRCWGFLRREGRLPSAGEIEQARALVGMARVHLDSDRRAVRFERRGMELNLGSIGKGYVLERMGRRLRARGVGRALLSAGSSSVLAVGGDRHGWPIDLCSRQVAGGRLARLQLRDGALGTSGAGEQFVDVKGTRYGHVLDPRTGWPASGVLSASVVTADPADADALSTAFLVGGLDLARRYCAAHPETLAIVTPDDGRPRVVGSYSGATIESGRT